jgi:hypothetical protein
LVRKCIVPPRALDGSFLKPDKAEEKKSEMTSEHIVEVFPFAYTFFYNLFLVYFFLTLFLGMPLFPEYSEAGQFARLA